MDKFAYVSKFAYMQINTHVCKSVHVNVVILRTDDFSSLSVQKLRIITLPAKAVHAFNENTLCVKYNQDKSTSM